MQHNAAGLALLSRVGTDFKCDSDGGVTFVDWSPGNGLRYQMVFTQLSEKICEAVGYSSSSWLVTDLNHSKRTMVLEAGALAHTSYVQEKLGLGDPSIQTILINCVVGDLPYARGVMSQALGVSALYLV